MYEEYIFHIYYLGIFSILINLIANAINYAGSEKNHGQFFVYFPIKSFVSQLQTTEQAFPQKIYPVSLKNFIELIKVATVNNAAQY